MVTLKTEIKGGIAGYLIFADASTYTRILSMI